jgi:GNAT superfamily N-acetyltransferase
MILAGRTMQTQLDDAVHLANTVFRLARSEDAEQLTLVYEHVFGPGGIKAKGHEAYPEPDVFSAAGVRKIIQNSKRHFLVAEVAGKIAGGMIVNYLNSFLCEFSCVAVDPGYQGAGLSGRLLSYARKRAEQTSLTINSTEIVTHSILSQTAHNSVGYGKVIGFGYSGLDHSMAK